MKVQKSQLNTRSSVKSSPMVQSNHPMIPFQWLMQPLLKVENNLLIKKKNLIRFHQLRKETIINELFTSSYNH